MANYYDPYGRRRPASRVARSGNPSGNSSRSLTMADYQQLAQAYQELQAQMQESQVRQQELQTRFEAQSTELKAELKRVQTELKIKNEALHQQSADFKGMESELVWTRAAAEQLQTKLDESGEESWQGKYTRLQADMENMRRRWDQRTSQQISAAKHEILLDMLPLADHLDLAMGHAGQLADGPAKEFLASIEATRHAFMETLKRYGVERLSPLHEPFDPNFHEAVGQIADANTEPDHVAHVVQAGYSEGERVIRPARVLVSSGAGQAQTASQTTEPVGVGENADARGIGAEGGDNGI